MSVSKGAVATYSALSKILSVIGYVFCFALVVVIPEELSAMTPDDTAATIIACGLMAFFSVFLVAKGSQLKRRNKRFKKYIKLVSKERITSMTGLASRTKRKVEFVRKDLQKMIDRKYFIQAHIDYQRDEIIIAGMDTEEELKPEKQYKVETETVKCKGCGAVNAKQKGKIINCEYCGSLIG